MAGFPDAQGSSLGSLGGPLVTLTNLPNPTAIWLLRHHLRIWIRNRFYRHSWHTFLRLQWSNSRKQWRRRRRARARTLCLAHLTRRSGSSPGPTAETPEPSLTWALCLDVKRRANRLKTPKTKPKQKTVEGGAPGPRNGPSLY